MPFAAAQFCRFLLPKTAKWIGDHSQISFYMWLASLVVIIGRTTAFIIDLHDASVSVELWLAFAALVICLGQFKVGRMLGRCYGDAPAGGQSLGQKNTVLAVWMAQSFLDPISSIAPTAYIVWQNFVNSYQIYKKDRETTKKSNIKSLKYNYLYLIAGFSVAFAIFPTKPILPDITILFRKYRGNKTKFAIFAVEQQTGRVWRRETDGQIEGAGANPVQAVIQRNQSII